MCCTVKSAQVTEWVSYVVTSVNPVIMVPEIFLGPGIRAYDG